MTNFPKISIVTPSFNQGRFIEKTILSVIEQDYPNLEYIIIDGGSTDESVEIIRKYEKHLAYWVSEPDRGQSHAINKGFERATGEIFGWLNSDDWYHPGALKAVAEAFAANPDAGAVVGAGEMVDEEGKQLYCKEPFLVSIQSLQNWFDKFFWQPSCFFREKTWYVCGPLDESLDYAMDLDLWFKISKTFRFSLIQQLLSTSLKHSNAKTEAYEYISIIEAATVICQNGGHAEAKTNLIKYLDYIKAKHDFETNELKAELNSKITDINMLSITLNNMLNSVCWKYTMPIRKISDIVSKVVYKLDNIIYYKIAIQLDSFDKGGLEEVVYSLVKYLYAKLNCKVVVFLNCNELGYFGSKCVSDGVDVVLLNNNLYLLNDALIKYRINIVNLHYSIFGYEIYSNYGIPMVYTVHNNYIWGDKEFFERRSAAYEKVSHFVAVSDQVANYFSNKFKISMLNISTISNGIDLTNCEKFYKVSDRSQYGINSEDFVYINVASFNWNKYHVLMIAAMHYMIARSYKVKLLFVGNILDVECYDYVSYLISKYNLTDYIRVLDYVPKEEVFSLLRMSDCFVLPSLTEGWSIAVMEAMYAGLPLILSDVGSARSVIDDSDIGIIIRQPYADISELETNKPWEHFNNIDNASNATELCDAMIAIYDNREEWKRKGLIGKRKIISMYSLEQMCASYFEVFKQTIKSN